MGYSTDYYGKIEISPAPSAQEIEVINAWLKCRHVKYDVSAIYQKDPEADGTIRAVDNEVIIEY